MYLVNGKLTSQLKRDWKDLGVYVQAYQTGYLVSNTHFTFLLPKDSKVFDSREIFPELPDNTETIKHASYAEPTDGPDMIKLIDKEYPNVTEPTGWLYEQKKDELLREFKGGLFIKDIYYSLLSTRFVYEYYYITPTEPLLIKCDGTFVGLIMPIKAPQ